MPKVSNVIGISRKPSLTPVSNSSPGTDEGLSVGACLFLMITGEALVFGLKLVLRVEVIKVRRDESYPHVMQDQTSCFQEQWVGALASPSQKLLLQSSLLSSL